MEIFKYFSTSACTTAAQQLMDANPRRKWVFFQRMDNNDVDHAGISIYLSFGTHATIAGAIKFSRQNDSYLMDANALYKGPIYYWGSDIGIGYISVIEVTE